jgi:ATP-dependent DNA helicase RecG
MNLESPVSDLPFVGPAYAKRLKKLEVETIRDLLHHIPRRYLDFRKNVSIKSLRVGEEATVEGEVRSAINTFTKQGRKMQIVNITDETGSIEAIWFNQPYILSIFKKGSTVKLAGKPSFFGRKLAFITPEYEAEFAKRKGVHTGRLVPIYSETRGVSSKWLRARVYDAYERTADELNEFLDKKILTKYKLPYFKNAIKDIHFPINFESVETGIYRLAYNELLFLHLASEKRKRDRLNTTQAHELSVKPSDLNKFKKSLPFTLTKSQELAIKELADDLAKNIPANRLLEGDVGSGKTVVAAAGCFIAFANGFQSVIMAPTQILAGQHYETLKSLLGGFDIRMNLITSSTKKGVLGRADVIVGTHSLIHKNTNFDKVAFAVIDESHRFGVEQREHLMQKTEHESIAPDVLTMTATPIPRTVALTAYGDLDLSVLTELPKGRKKITTWVVPNNKRIAAYKWIDNEIEKNKIQVFVVCPLIEESESEILAEVKSVKKEFEKLSKKFTGRKLGILHGKLKAKEKDGVLDAFRNKKIDILVSTPVIEVGVDIPNANIMLVEGADRFGLAQLHQLRGRIGRGEKKSYCMLFTDSKSVTVAERLNALRSLNSGFELAELDLKLRGPGEIFGKRQSGFPELKIASWSDIELIKKTKNLAISIANNPRKYPKTTSYLKHQQKAAN